MYSKKLQEYVDSHRPATAEWDYQGILSLAEKAGLGIRPTTLSSREGGVEIVSYGEKTRQTEIWIERGFGPFRWQAKVRVERREQEWHLFEQSHSMKVLWGCEVTSSEVRFTPYLTGGGCEGGTFGSAPDPWKRFLGAAGLEEIVVPLPERAVELPIPSWVWGWAREDPWSGVILEGNVVYSSEVEEWTTSYLDELTKLVEECQATEV